MNPAAIESILAENVRAQQAFDAALMSLDGMTHAQFSAKHLGVDIAALMSNPEFMQQMELFAANPEVQSIALNAQLRRGMSEAVTGLVAKIQAPDASGTALCAASDALTKISNLIDRQDAAKRDGGEQGIFRSMVKSWGKIKITTIEGETEFGCDGRDDDEILLRAIRAMRCTCLTEVSQVMTAASSKQPMVVLHLRWF